MEKLEWHNEKRKVSELLPYDKNPRKINQKQLADLTKSFKKFNLVEIPVVDTDGKIVAGHQRLKVLLALNRGEEMIDVRVPNRRLTDQEYEQYLISSNKLGGTWDTDKLKSFDVGMLLESGFESIELSEFWDKELEAKDDEFDVTKELEKIKEPKTKTGDIIILGKHRIICGDSTDPKVVQKLCGNERVSMIYSDPVYNINIDYNGGIGGKRSYGGAVCDSRGFDEYKDFLCKSMEAALAVSHEDIHVFYWCDQVYIGVIQELYRKLGIENKRVCLWIKNSQNPTPGVAFNKCYEPCVYGVRNKPYLTHNINTNNEVVNRDMTTGNNLHDQIDLWLTKRLSGKDMEHATSKPVSLHEKAIKRCTKPNDIILDSFLGSGSTLLAGEQLGRKVFGCEKEPVFCDLIIKRFIRLTGINPQVIHHEEK